jgi:hypothetical protein
MFLLKLINTGHHNSSPDTLNFLLFTQTGALFLFASFFAQINAVVGVSTPSTGDFTTSWYQSVGVGIVLVQIGDIASPHLTKVSILPDRLMVLDPPSSSAALSLPANSKTKKGSRVGSHQRSPHTRGIE